MIENSRKIRELMETIRAERDIRIRNRMMMVLGILKDHSTKTASGLQTRTSTQRICE